MYTVKAWKVFIWIRDVPTDGIDATVPLRVQRANWYTSIRSSGGSFPIFQNVRSALRSIYREYIQPSKIPSGSRLAR